MVGTVEISQSRDTKRYNVIVTGFETVAAGRAVAEEVFASLGLEMDGQGAALRADRVRPAGMMYGQTR